MTKPFVVLLLLSTAAAGCRHGDEEEAAPVVAVKIAQAEVADVPLTIEAPGMIYGKAQANISSRITAPIRRLMARKGDTVKSGEVLAILESRDLEAQQDDARAALTDAEASLEKAKNGSLLTDLQRARSELAAKEAALALAQKIYDRRSDLYRQGAISGRELQTSEADRTQAKANYDVARLNLDVLEHHTSSNDLTIAESKVVQAKAHRALADAEHSFAELKSPMKGAITEQFMYPGDMAKPDLPLFTVVDLSVAVARVQVPESRAAQIVRGQSCGFAAPDASLPVLTGKITVVNQAVDPARRTVEVWCEIPNAKGLLKTGMFGKASILVGTANRAVVVPQSAVEFQEGTTHGKAYVVDGQHVAHLHEVEASAIDGHKVRVMRGIAPGEGVIVQGGYGLPDGTKVEPTGASH
jgi:multidrug efflux pump subunit AcrA (membrane-fusion protein)